MTAPWDRPPEYFERGEDKPGELAAAVAARREARVRPRSGVNRATVKNMPRSRYGVAAVHAIDIDDSGPELRTLKVTYWKTAIDLLAEGITPRPYYSERRAMDAMSPTRLGAYLVLRRLYFSLPYRITSTRLVRFLWRHAR